MRTRGIKKSLIKHLVQRLYYIRIPAHRGKWKRMRFILPSVLAPIVAQLGQYGYRALVVGGAVRDALLGHDTKDIDIEGYGISYERLAEILSSHGRADLVGKSFGVIKLTPKDGCTYDFSVPRRDSKTGRSNRDFLSPFDQ